MAKSPTKSSKTLSATDAKNLKAKVPDVNHFGDPNAFKLITKSWSKDQGWMRSTKGLEIRGIGVVVNSCTQQRNPDGSWALSEALSFIPGTSLIEHKNEKGEVVSREITHYVASKG